MISKLHILSPKAWGERPTEANPGVEAQGLGSLGTTRPGDDSGS
jgi:hypothetical protein